MEITGLLMEAIAIASNHCNQMPLLHTSGMPIFCGPNMKTFLYQYESLVTFTATNITESSIISMFPYYCDEESTHDKVMMMRG